MARRNKTPDPPLPPATGFEAPSAQKAWQAALVVFELERQLRASELERQLRASELELMGPEDPGCDLDGESPGKGLYEREQDALARVRIHEERLCHAQGDLARSQKEVVSMRSARETAEVKRAQLEAQLETARVAFAAVVNTPPTI